MTTQKSKADARAGRGDLRLLPRLGLRPVGRAEGGKVNINTATASELETLPRVGPKVAQRIIDFRTKNGNFKKVEEIMKVQGIGEKVFEDIKDLITVGGENAANSGSFPLIRPRPCPDASGRGLFSASRNARSLRTARPRWLTAFLTSGGSSAKVCRRGG